MNTTSNDLPRDPPEGALGAAEYVLGLLDAAGHRAAHARLQRDAAFAREVSAWTARFAPLLEEIAAVPVALAVWPRIQVAAGLAAKPESTRTPAPSFWHNLGLWRWLTAAGFATAAASLATLFLAAPHLPPRNAAAMVATMARDDGTAAFVASIDAANGKLVVLPVAAEIPADRVAELWLIPPGDAPHSLGLLDARHAREVIVPAALRGALGAKALVAVSLEPPGGAPAGKPTGPIVAKGEIALL
ncbi:MAG: anti-sigma factor [Proteobacteria bacterium]|nr:anti-sigma factor [Pseudomonadota bacterium]